MTTIDEVYDAIAGDWWWEHLRKPCVNLVRGFGSREPRVMLVGEAPGAVENLKGRPFCGPSGLVLDHLMGLAGIYLVDTEIDGGLPVNANAYATNLVKYRPAGNATPSVGDVIHAREGFRQRRIETGFQEVLDETWPEGAGSLREEWAALGRPPVIVCVGGVAHSAISPMCHEPVGRWVGYVFDRHGTIIISQYHPAYGLHQRNPDRRKEIQDAMSQSWEEMGQFLEQEGIL